MRIRFFALFVCFCSVLFEAIGQEYRVASVTGDAFCYKQGTAEKLSPRQALSAKDTVYIGERSALNVVKGDKLYSLRHNKDKETLGQVVRSQERSAISRFAKSFITALMRGDTEKINHDANVVYKDAASDMIVYAALRNEDYVSRLPLSMKLIDTKTGEDISSEVSVGQKFFFRIRNDSSWPLYVNVLDRDSEGGFYDCLPMDVAGSMLHLLVPAESEVDLAEHSMEFTEPAGTDRLILVGYGKPFDLRNVIKAFQNNEKYAATVENVATYPISITIQ
jgi:hypothetical protein